MERGEVIAFHRKAGLGRTGTLLVFYLIWEGAPPQEALEVARSIEPGWVQSDIQEQYLFSFATVKAVVRLTLQRRLHRPRFQNKKAPVSPEPSFQKSC